MWLQLAIVTLLAAFVQGVAGFGFTLLALFFYLLALQSTEAVQLVTLMNFAITVALVTRLWRRVPGRPWGALVVGGVLGFPVGLWWFARADVTSIELAVSLVTLGFTLTVLGRELLSGDLVDDSGVSLDDGSGGAGTAPPPRVSSAAVDVSFRPASATLVGAVAGAMTAALGAPGPPIALYLSGLGIDKTTFRALSLASFLMMQIFVISGQVGYVGVAPQVWRFAATLAPIALLGAGLGHLLSHAVSERLFRRCVLLLLLAAGVYMLYRATSG